MSKAKITLSMDSEVIRQAKIRALQDGIHVSAAVEEFLNSWSAGGKDTALLRAAVQQRGNEKALLEENTSQFHRIRELEEQISALVPPAELISRIRELEAGQQLSSALLDRLAAQARSWAQGGGEAPAVAVLTTLAAYEPPPARCTCGPASSGEEPDCCPDCPAHGAPAVFADVTVPAKDVPQIAALAPEAFQPYHQDAEPDSDRAKWHPESEDYGSGRIARDHPVASMPGPDTPVRQFLASAPEALTLEKHPDATQSVIHDGHGRFLQFLNHFGTQAAAECMGTAGHAPQQEAPGE